jgi:hypothetical protein
MNKTIRKAIESRMAELVSSKNAFISCEASRILLALSGIWCSEGLTQSTLPKPPQAQAELAIARAIVWEAITQKKARKKAANRRAYLRRKIKKLEAQENNGNKNN